MLTTDGSNAGAHPHVAFFATLGWVHCFKYSRTSSEWPSGLTLWKTCLILPSGPMTNVVRTTPITFFPYIFFSWITPKALQSFLSASASRENGRGNFSWNFFWAAGVWGDAPSSTTPDF